MHDAHEKASMLHRSRGCRVASAQRAASARALRPRDSLHACLYCARVPVSALWPMHRATLHTVNHSRLHVPAAARMKRKKTFLFIEMINKAAAGNLHWGMAGIEPT